MENSGNNISQPQQLNNLQSRRAGKTAFVSSAWSHVVRGESETSSVAPLSPPAAVSSPTALSEQVLGSASSSSNTDDEICNGNAGKRPAWNVPSNGAVEIGPVMGAVSWPALSESARVSSKSSPPDGSSSAVPVSGGVPASSSPQRQVNNNATPNSTPNHTTPQRQRSIKPRNSAPSSDGSYPQPLVVSQGHVAEVHHSNNPSPRDHGSRSSQPRSSNEQHSGQQRSSFRNRNGGGPHSRADGSYNHHSYGGGRRDQDRGNQDWNTHNRSFNGRDGHVQQPQRVTPRFVRHPPPPASTPFMGPAPVRPFGAPMGFPELASPLYYMTGPPPPQTLRGVPFVPGQIQPHAMFFPAPDFQLHSKIVAQIDYYFSNENLIRDTFLRQNMDEEGWVPIKLIAGFNKVSHLTDNIQFILDALRSSTVVEVQGDKVRRRHDWMRWLLPPSVQFPSAPSPSPQGLGKSNQEMLAGNVQNMSLEEVSGQSNARRQADIQSKAFQSRSSSGDFSSQPQPSSSHEGLDHFTSAKN
ncbi:unnamed protein product [Linum tenue]|uniref:HTH La-type RNA-binding domain-containing protein n=1 Tax=Linum tenue TaxID=586396 RepID=A0AAV0I592_9ROSI|nr:unnamed protein product [Linum tenue]